MIRIGIFGKVFSEDASEYVEKLMKAANKFNCELVIYKPFHSFLSAHISLADINSPLKFFQKPSELKNKVDVVITIGGDGTILDLMTVLQDAEIPILGVNTGRLGFLANTSKEETENVVEKLIHKKYRLDKRVLLEVRASNKAFKDFPFAMNELTVHKKDSSSMITIHTKVNGELLNSYWADGLIVSTPTGSTAYSLSCGGPIVMPGSFNYIITPIAPHNLNVRPIVVSDDVQIELEIEGRGKHYLTTVDSRTEVMEFGDKICLKKSKIKVFLIQLEGETYFNTLRNKLNWGIDKRN